MMSRKNYRAFAEMLKEIGNDIDIDYYDHCNCGQSVLYDVERRMVSIFKADNPKFQEGRFRKASGSLK